MKTTILQASYNNTSSLFRLIRSGWATTDSINFQDATQFLISCMNALNETINIASNVTCNNPSETQSKCLDGKFIVKTLVYAISNCNATDSDNLVQQNLYQCFDQMRCDPNTKGISIAALYSIFITIAVGLFLICCCMLAHRLYTKTKQNCQTSNPTDYQLLA